MSALGICVAELLNIAVKVLLFLQAIGLAACYKEDWPVLVLVPSALRLHWAIVSEITNQASLRSPLGHRPSLSLSQDRSTVHTVSLGGGVAEHQEVAPHPR